MEEPSCYVYRSKRDRPSKRRRLDGDFSEEDLRKRLLTYEQEWMLQDKGFEEAMCKATLKPLERVVQFVQSSNGSSFDTKIPTGLIVSSPSASSGFLDRVQAREAEDGRNAFVTLVPSDGPNLKSLLKNLIQKATQSNRLGRDDDEHEVADVKRPRYLNYDLQILHDWSRTKEIDKLIVATRDSEAFDINVFSEFVTLLHSWLDRLPIVLLVAVATSVDIFQDRLPPSAIQCMGGETFDVTETTEILEQAFRCCTAAEGCTLHPGPGFADLLIQRNRDHIQGVGPLRQAVKYAYMCHFYGNPVAAFLKQDLQAMDFGATHFSAVRNTVSFKQHVERLLEEGQRDYALDLLESDVALLKEITKSISRAHGLLEWLCGALSVISELREPLMINSRTSTAFSNLYVKSLSGSLSMSAPLICELLLNSRKASLQSIRAVLPSFIDTINSMPLSVIDISAAPFTELQIRLAELLPADKAPGKVPVKEIQQLQTRFHDLLKEYLNATLLPGHYASCLPFHEIYIYDLKSLHRDAFTPRPRFVIERALSRPHDYLGCACCKPGSAATEADGREGGFRQQYEDGGVNGHAMLDNEEEGGEDRDNGTANNPATSMLYQLVLESGSLVNVQDLWTAFRARLSGTRGVVDPPLDTASNGVDELTVNGADDEDLPIEREGRAEMTVPDGSTAKNDLQTRALFSRGLAELKYLGIVRQSRKKADCLQKVLWGHL